MGKASPPPPPDYTPFVQASQQTAAADSHAADLQFQLGQEQLAAQQKYADQAAARGDQYFQMSQDAQKFGQDQFNTVWPYAKDYLSSQDALSKLAGQNATEQMQVAETQRQQAADTYARYMSTFSPIENAFASFATNYNTPVRAAAASAGAQADVATSFGAQADAARNQLRSYGIDPSQARYQGADAIMRSQQAAASAAAGTQARRASELTGAGLTQQAIAVGQKLPTVALGQIAAGTGASSSGITSGAAGGAGIGAANQALQVGSAATGSPTAYGAFANPYTTLAGTSASLTGSLFGGGTSALGNESGAIQAGAGALTSGFSAQMQNFNAMVAQQNQFASGLGQLVGGIGGLATAFA
jgi:hypothetical protein